MEFTEFKHRTPIGKVSLSLFWCGDVSGTTKKLGIRQCWLLMKAEQSGTRPCILC